MKRVLFFVFMKLFEVAVGCCVFNVENIINPPSNTQRLPFDNATSNKEA